MLPLLEDQLGPGIAEALARTAALAREDADLLDSLAAEARAEVELGDELDCGGLARLPGALRRRLLLHWLTEGGARDLGLAHVQSVDALVVDWRGQGPVEVPGLSVVRREGRLATTRFDPRDRDPGRESGVSRRLACRIRADRIRPSTHP